MDNFRKQQGKRPSNPVDGIVSGNGRKGSMGTPSNSRPSISANGARFQRGSLDNFRPKDGFNPSQQPKLQGDDRPIGRKPLRRGPNGTIDLSLPPAPPVKRGRFGRSKKNRSRKQKAMRSFAGVLLFVMVIGGFLFGKGYLKFHQIFKGGGGAAALEDNVDPTRLNGEGDGRVNILLLGRGGEGHTAPDLTDTIIVASIDPVQKKAALLSIPRDLWVTPEDGGSTKINAVYANAKYAAQDDNKNDTEADAAGLKSIEAIVEKTMGIPIHYHVVVDFAGFEEAINTVGGVDIDVKEENTVYEVLYDPTVGKRYVLDVKTGMQHFDGKRALFYSRSRQTSSRGDFDRAERQRLVMVALKDKILSAGTFANPVKVSGLIDNLGDHIKANLSISELMRIYEIGKNIQSQDIASVGLADPPNNFVTTANINGLSIVRPRAGLTDFSEIQNFVRNALRDGYLTKEEAVVAVYNGTATPGLAAKKSTELKSFGYTIGTVANAPTSTYQKTVVVDLTNGQKKYTKNYLEKRFGVTAVTTIPDSTIPAGTNDFIIIVGQDQQ